MIEYRRHIRSGADLRTALGRTMNARHVDDRWNEDDRRWAINQALEWVGSRLRIPFVWQMPSSMNAESLHELPDYIEGPLDPQRGFGSEDSPGYWHHVMGYRVVPTSAGKRAIEFPFTVGSGMRITYWPTNPPQPTEEVALMVDLNTGDDMIVLDTPLDNVGQNGYLNINGEVIEYHGVLQGATTTLLNLGRSVNGLSQAVAPATSIVEWCVASHTQAVYQAMLWWAASWLHGTYLNRASKQERDLHDMQQRLYIQLANEHMQTNYQPARTPKLRMDRVASGGYTY